MKSMKKVQVAVAVAALFAATGSMAASISQSGLTIAREVIAANTTLAQSVKAPAVSYSFDNGPTANAASSQDFNVTLKLGGDGTPEWGANVPTYKTISAVRRNNGSQVVPVVGAAYPAAAGVVFIRLMGVDDVDAQTKRFRFRLENNTAASVSLGDLQLSFNSVNPGNGPAAPYIIPTDAGAFDAAAAAGAPLNVAPIVTEFNNIVKLAASANANTLSTGTAPGETGYYDSNDLANQCGEGLRRVTVQARNYIGSGAGVEGESAGANVSSITNNGYIVFGTALSVKVNKGAARDRATDPTANNVQLTIPTGSGVASNVMALGRVVFGNVSNLDAWDTDTTGTYYKLRPGAAASPNIEFTTATNNNVGGVDMTDAATGALTLKIDSTNGFATGTTFALSNSPNCDAAAPTVSTVYGQATTAGATSVNLFFTDVELAALVGAAPANNSLITPTIGTYAAYYGTAPVSGNNGFYICMKTPGGAAQIPQSTFKAVAKLIKKDPLEQNNYSCPGDLAGLGGGVKIDVRNFFPYQNDSQEWISILRVINNSETTDADLTGQYIRADGKYGKWGSLGTLKARGAVYFTSKEIDTLLANNTTTAGAAITDNTGAGGTTGDAGKVAPNTRVRVSSNSASTLRVQNYMFNTKTLQLVEVSASQGADFVNVESSARDHIDQDAQTGIKK